MSGATSPTAVPLDVFFDRMVALLRSEESARAVAEALGAPDAARRLAMVAAMVRQARLELLRGVYGATAKACATVDGDRFDEAVRLHLASEAGAEPDFAAIALGFPAALEKLAPAWVVEVADYEESLHRLRVVGAPPFAAPLRTPVIARAYSFDVPAWIAAARRGEVRAPRPAPTPVLLHRDRDEAVRRLRPTPAVLAALAIATGEASAEALAAAGLDDAAIAEGRAALAHGGILA